MSVDVAPAIRTAIIANSTVTALLSTYKGAASVHTRVPIPTGVTLPYVVIGPDVSVTDYDGLRSDRPQVIRDVFVYGAAGSSRQDDYRDVETVAYELRNMFHREKTSLTVTGYDVVDLVANGPIPAPSSDDEIIGRVVTLTIRLRSST